jgi:hypothetical protein
MFAFLPYSVFERIRRKSQAFTQKNKLGKKMMKYVLVLLPLIFLLGCGAADNRFIVTGKVTFDGKPLEDGAITFFPLDKGTTASGAIKDGSYSARLFSGKFTVQITSQQKTGKQFKDESGSGMLDEVVQIIPARYNTESELTAEFSKEKKQADFELKGK